MSTDNADRIDFERPLSALINISEALKEYIKSEETSKAIELAGSREKIAHQLFELPWSESKVEQYRPELERIEKLDQEIVSMADTFKLEIEQQIKDVKIERQQLAEQISTLSKGQNAINAYGKARKAFK